MASSTRAWYFSRVVNSYIFFYFGERFSASHAADLCHGSSFDSEVIYFRVFESAMLAGFWYFDLNVFDFNGGEKVASL